MMRLYRLHRPSLDGLVQGTEPTPEPGTHEVLVRLHAASLNYKDLLFVKPASEGGIELPRPMVPLSDAAGEVMAVGSAVTRFAVGDPVSAVVVTGWFEGPIPRDAMPRALGVGHDGVLSEFRCFPEMDLVKLPKGYSYRDGSTLPIAALTAWNAVEHVEPGQTVVVLGTGGVALFALQFAKAAGAHVIITSSSDEKIQRAKALGADEAVNYRTTPAWHEKILEMTDGRGADHIVETVSGSSLELSVAATALGGHIHLVGLQDRGRIDPYGIQYRAITVRGIRMGSKRLFESMIGFIERHDIRPAIDKVFPFEDVRPAYEYLKHGLHFGKVVIDLG
ncbi:zinc-dependent alcohol dehydrogenase family protein [Hyalangium versicolor]|uniref:zinc-dependent alcohol dehydrogenase family protein n=1 Tax=Hyalangium versicolor TaxID=2861190 RepID=UPI001CCE7E65|nr:NAD(P)-dependent alcohol dehydrogenase [Hyalangium versicolor]